MAYEHHHARRVEFADTDAAGILHFSRFTCYAEEAEHAFLRSVGWSVHREMGDHFIGLPRLGVRFEFFRPARFEDVLDVHIWLARKGSKTLTYHIVVTRDGEEEALAHGELTVICCRCWNDGRMESVPIPAELADHLTTAPRAPLEFKNHV